MEIIDNTNNKITLPITRGNNPINRLQSIYGTLFMHKYGFKIRSTIYPQLGKVFKDLLKDFTEIQIAYLLIIYFDWAGMSGDNQSDRQWLESKSHDIFQFRFGLQKYETYIRNVLLLGTEFDTDSELLKLVGEHITSLK